MSLELVKYFNPIKLVDKANEIGLLKLAARVSAQAKALAPVNKMSGGGRLRNSIMYRTSTGEGGFNDSGMQQADRKIDSKASRGEGFIGINLDYAIYQEFGTRKMSPQPYLRPAIAIKVYGRGFRDVANDIDEEVAKGKRTGGSRVKFY